MSLVVPLIISYCNGASNPSAESEQRLPEAFSELPPNFRSQTLDAKVLENAAEAHFPLQRLDVFLLQLCRGCRSRRQKAWACGRCLGPRLQIQSVHRHRSARREVEQFAAVYITGARAPREVAALFPDVFWWKW